MPPAEGSMYASASGASTATHHTASNNGEVATAALWSAAVRGSASSHLPWHHKRPV